MNDKQWIVRACAWELCALAFSEPTEELLNALDSDQYYPALYDIANALRFIPLIQDMNVILFDEKTIDAKEALRSEFSRLFTHLGQDETPLCLSAYWAKRKDVTHLMFVNPIAMKLNRLMKSCGISSSNPQKEACDSVPVICSFAQYLALQRVKAESSDAAQVIAESYADLMDSIPLEDVESFVRALDDREAIPFYKIHARLFRDLVQEGFLSHREE